MTVAAIAHAQQREKSKGQANSLMRVPSEALPSQPTFAKAFGASAGVEASPWQCMRVCLEVLYNMWPACRHTDANLKNETHTAAVCSEERMRWMATCCVVAHALRLVFCRKQVLAKPFTCVCAQPAYLWRCQSCERVTAGEHWR